MEPSSAPTPLPSPNGLLRWSPVEGANGYEIWFVDIPKFEVVYTNVIDEREFYTFHRTDKWTGTVRWRIRALRDDHDKNLRQNGLPAVGYGPWSSVYSSHNDPYVGGQIRLVGAVSDTVSDGSPSSPSHRLMPGFVFSGDQTLSGASAELFRVYVFTDRQCLNRVYTSAVIGGPAYAPRPYGPLPLPKTLGEIPLARSTYFLNDGAEPDGYTYDAEKVLSTESMPSATPTTAAPADTDTNPSGGATAASAGPQQLQVTGQFGAPVDLWDTEDPSQGYYWTVVPVGAFSPGALTTAVSGAGAVAAATSVPVVAAGGFGTGDAVVIGNSGNQETATVTSAAGGTISLAAPLKFSHGQGEPVIRTGGSLQYRDLELPQDVCAPPYDRVARFSKDSEPTLTSTGELFASGLSSSGGITSGNRVAPFYGSPLVAWTPALGADAYEVQWSKTRYPFRPDQDPENQNALGRMTLGTSAVLPLKPGTWYYRVRGFSFALRTGAQEMSWSDPARIVVAKPKFRIVGGGK